MKTIMHSTRPPAHCGWYCSCSLLERARTRWRRKRPQNQRRPRASRGSPLPSTRAAPPTRITSTSCCATKDSRRCRKNAQRPGRDRKRPQPRPAAREPEEAGLRASAGASQTMFPAEAVRDFGYQPVATAKDPYRTLFIVVKGSPLQDHRDVRGRTIVTPDQYSNMWRAANAMLRDSKIDMSKENGARHARSGGDRLVARERLFRRRRGQFRFGRRPHVGKERRPGHREEPRPDQHAVHRIARGFRRAGREAARGACSPWMRPKADSADPEENRPARTASRKRRAKISSRSSNWLGEEVKPLKSPSAQADILDNL